MQHQDNIGPAFFQENLECSSRHTRGQIGLKVDRVADGPAIREQLREAGDGVGGQLSKVPSLRRQGVGCQDTDSSAVRQDRQPVSRQGSCPGEGLNGIEELLDVEDPEHAGAAKCRRVYGVGQSRRFMGTFEKGARRCTMPSF